MGKDDAWVMDEIKIEIERFGKNEGKYTGYIRFRNGGRDSFCFQLDEVISGKYLELIADEVVDSATKLGQKIASTIKA